MEQIVCRRFPLNSIYSIRRAWEHIIMYEQFTDFAHKVIELANSEAKRFNHEYISPDHTLLAVTKLGHGVAAVVLRKLNVNVQKVRLKLENSMKSGPNDVTTGKLPQTPEMKNVIQYAIDEARNLNHPMVGTQHILLGLLREQEGVPAFWNTLGVTLEDARAEVSRTSQEGQRPPFIPGDPDQHVRNAIKSIWVILPEKTRNVDEVERQLHRLVDHTLQDFRDDIEAFFRT